MDFPYHMLQEVFSAFIFHTWVILDTFGIIANIINIIVFTKMGLKDNVTITLLVLSISDLTFLTLHFPSSVGELIYRAVPDHFWGFDSVLLTVTPVFVQWFVYYYSCQVAAFLALVRCMCVARPLQFKTMFTVSRTFKILLVLFVVNFGLRLPAMTAWRFVWKVNPKTNSSVKNYLSYAFAPYNKEVLVFDNIANTLVLSYTLFAITGTCTAILAYKLRQAAKFRNSLAHGGGGGETAGSASEAGGRASVEMSDNKGDKNIPAGGIIVGRNQGQNAGGELVVSQGQKNTKTTINQGQGHHADKRNKQSEKLSGRDVQVVKSVTLVCVVYVVAQVPSLFNYTTQLATTEFDFWGKWRNLWLTVDQFDITCQLVNASINIFIYINFNTRYRTIFMSPFRGAKDSK